LIDSMTANGIPFVLLQMEIILDWLQWGILFARLQWGVNFVLLQWLSL